MMRTIPQLRDEAIAGTLAAVRQAGVAGGPVVVGPWLSEIGFELLYWIPFLRWVLPEAGIPRDRVVVLSRGGCAHWYGDLADTYIELFEHLSPDEVRVLNRERIAQQASAGPEIGLRVGHMTAKQYSLMRAERELLQRVGLKGAALVHPSLMYRLFRLYWRHRVRDLYDRCARVLPMLCPVEVSPIAKPYVAVKFYSSQACADRDGTAATVRQIVARLADVMPVVVIDSGEQYDDHGVFLMDDPRVTVLANLDPRTNLMVQTAVIAHASAFIGTYGGFSYLAPLLGVPTTALYTDRNFRDDHLQLACRIFREQRVRFDVGDLTAGLIHLQRDDRWIHAA